ncbi:hypothetical protein V1264_011197 [Littorina saxatilis]|uniref:Uncharacterized protein n=2 Tax=Littorina saxatilis TaxID=31220 RepID=A0AAN9GKN3_9CAEN
MYPKPKSAPGRFPQSKFVKNRTNAMKEIEAWVKKDDDPWSSGIEASRMSGQLTDNVTEERMLRSKLWELSKERYKFLTQNNYEKKMFTDRMQRKSGALLRRANSAAAASTRDGDTDSSKAGLTPAKQRWRNTRQAFIGQISKNKDKARSVEEGEEEKPAKGGAKKKESSAGSRGRLTPPATPISVAPAVAVTGGKVLLAPLSASPLHYAGGREEGSPLQRKPPPSPVSSANPRNVNFDRLPTSEAAPSRWQGQTQPPGRGRSSPNLNQPGPFPSPGAVTSRPPSDSSKPNSATSLRSKPWSGSQASSTQGSGAVEAFGGKRGLLANRFGMRLESKTEDPRYAQLESSLSPVNKQRSPGDIKAIVKTFDALHVPSRRRPEAKPKTELKALEYIEEQGFLFWEKR